MRQLFFFVVLSIFSLELVAQERLKLPVGYKDSIISGIKPFYTPSENQMEALLNGEVIADGNVDSPSDKEQRISLFAAGIHPRSCHMAMRKLSLYENYNKYIDFIKQSSYDESKQQIHFVMDHALLPFPMNLTFKLPRITGPGHYPFTFDHGFLKDLKGTVGVANMSKFCILTLKVDWKGPATKIPNFPFEAFVQTVGKIGLDHLIRVSRF